MYHLLSLLFMYYAFKWLLLYIFSLCPVKTMVFSPTVVSGLLTNLSTLFASKLLLRRWYTN